MGLLSANLASSAGKKEDWKNPLQSINKPTRSTSQRQQANKLKKSLSSLPSSSPPSVYLY